MNRIYRLLNQTLLLTVIAAAAALAAQVESVRLFSEQDYSRLSIGFDGPFVNSVETNPAEKLIFIKFEGVGIDKLSKQSYLYDNSPFLESVSFLPLGGDQIVARVKTRQDFRLKTYESAKPYRLILELSSKAIKSAPQPPANNDSYYQLGLEQMGDGSMQAALMSFRSAIRSGDRVPESYYQAGRIRLRLGEFDKAQINFSRAARDQNHTGEASLYLSWTHFKQGDRDKMAASWREFVRRVPDAAGRFRIATNNPEIDFRSLEDAVTAGPGKAVAKLESSPDALAGNERNSPDAAWYFEQGVAAKQEGRLAAAAKLLEQAAGLDPDDSEVHFQLGVVYKGMGRKQDSARQFQLSLGTGVKLPDLEQHGLPQAADIGQQVTANNNFDHLEPLFDDAATNFSAGPRSGTESSNEDEAVVAGGLGGSAGTPPSVVAPATSAGALNVIRGAAAGMINQYGIALLRNQVEILTGLMGLIFLLTLAAERFFRRRRNKRTSMAGPGLPALVVAGASSAGGPSVQVFRNSPVSAATNKQQVAQVLARELESKRRVSQPLIEEVDTAVGLQLKPVGERGMYGVDIARRIKEELSPQGAPSAASSALAGRGRDDMQTRLIRQLRSKSWTIGDIAQEMSLSREEIKWALAGNGSDHSAATGDQSQTYGQLNALAAQGRNRRAERIDTERIDREVSLELEINV